MNVLVVGGGGREHALVWKLSQSPEVKRIYTAPGNPGTERIGTNVPISSDDIPRLLEFALTEGMDLTVVGPEAPLVAGIVDRFREKGLRIFGPPRATAELEGSKSFAKAFMKDFGVPTASAEVFEELKPAEKYVREKGVPIVVKADGLAAGKGVTVAYSLENALEALSQCFVKKTFGEAGERVVIEEFLVGEEASMLAICDGDKFVSLPPSQDHKPVFDGDKGPNTGGMGAYSPAPVVSAAIQQEIEDDIIQPVLDGMKKRGAPYVGVLYAGLMITTDGPKVVEFNCRMGDPETQAVLPIVESDLFELFFLASEGRLGEHPSVRALPKTAVCVVLVSDGYPGPYEKGAIIEGLESLDSDPEVVVFHAGTKRLDDGSIMTSGGRVLGITGLGEDLGAAIDKAYGAVKKVSFQGAHFREDIGAKGVRR